MKFVIQLISLFCITFIFFGCVNLKEPNINFLDQQITSIDLQKIDLIINFLVSNPNDIGSNDVEYSYKIRIKNIEILKKENIPLQLPANKTVTLALPITFYYESIFDGTLEILKSVLSEEKTLPYQVEGALAIKALGIPLSIPFSHSGEIPLPEISDIKLF
jgi:LEA14-like dessication related protein